MTRLLLKIAGGPRPTGASARQSNMNGSLSRLGAVQNRPRKAASAMQVPRLRRGFNAASMRPGALGRS